MLTFIKKIPWWLWVVVGVVSLLVINNVSGSVYSNKLWNMIADQIREDQTKIVQTLEQIVSEREEEIATLELEIQKINQQRIEARAETERLKGKISELQNQRQNIVVSGDPGELVDEFHTLGFRSVFRYSH